MLEWTEDNNIKALEEVCAVGWIAKDNDVMVHSIEKKWQVDMRPMAIKLEKPRSLSCNILVASSKNLMNSIPRTVFI